jgi:hypothetical protein
MVEWTTYLFFRPVRLTSSKTHPVRPGGEVLKSLFDNTITGDVNRRVLVFYRLVTITRPNLQE